MLRWVISSQYPFSWCRGGWGWSGVISLISSLIFETDRRVGVPNFRKYFGLLVARCLLPSGGPRTVFDASVRIADSN